MVLVAGHDQCPSGVLYRSGAWGEDHGDLLFFVDPVSAPSAASGDLAQKAGFSGGASAGFLEKPSLPHFQPDLTRFPGFGTLQNYQKQGIAFAWKRENPMVRFTELKARFSTDVPAPTEFATPEAVRDAPKPGKSSSDVIVKKKRKPKTMSRLCSCTDHDVFLAFFSRCCRTPRTRGSEHLLRKLPLKSVLLIVPLPEENFRRMQGPEVRTPSSSVNRRGRSTPSGASTQSCGRTDSWTRSRITAWRREAKTPRCPQNQACKAQQEAPRTSPYRR